MDLKLLRNLVRLMERGELNELKIDDEKAGLSVHLKRGVPAQAGAAAPPVVMVPGAGAVSAPAPVVGMGVADPGAPAADLGSDAELAEGVEQIVSPMVGTFYRASSPDAEPFASEGTNVGEDDVVCIIEAMKVMNDIKAECRGEIIKILVDNGDPVEFGQPLFLVKSS